MPVGISRADQNRAIRQEALRESLEAGGHIQHVVDISNKLADLEVELNATEISRLQKSADIKLKLIDKYLPALKLYESTGEEDEAPTSIRLILEDARTEG